MFRGLAAVACLAALQPVAAAAAPAISEASFLVVRPAAGELALRSAPNGPVLVRLGPRTSFGTPLVLGVVARRGNWLGVTTDALANGRVGWVDSRSSTSVGVVHEAIRVSLSARRLELFRSGRLVQSFTVAIGASSSPTPIGRFAVAEKLAGPSIGTVYGCCILGLSAHQPHPPAGWKPGNYLVAIHGGGGIGAAVSAGCIHLAEPALRYLMRSVPLGTPVFIEA